MLVVLGARNKEVFVNGSYPELDVAHPDYGSWSRCNNIIYTWIVNAVEKLIAKSIMYLDLAWFNSFRTFMSQFSLSSFPCSFDLSSSTMALVDSSDFKTLKASPSLEISYFSNSLATILASSTSFCNQSSKF